MDFGASPFEAVGAPLLMAEPEAFHGEAAVFGACGVAVFVIADFFEPAFVSGIIGDYRFAEMELVFQEAIGVDAVEGRIAEERVRLETGMDRKEIGEDGLQ